jgi:cysteine desulfurase
MYSNKQIIYFDNNATTQVDKRVLDAMLPYLTTHYANSNSKHYFGTKINEAVNMARGQIAEFIGAEMSEIVFTSGATEAINLAIKGIAENYSSKGKHIVTISTEHHAVLDTCKNLETKGFEVSYIPVKSDGIVDLEELKKVLRDDTILVSAMLVNNETGVFQPIQEISDLAHSVGAFILSDATQAIGKVRVDVKSLDVDFLCLSGHKFNAPKGIGALYMRKQMNRFKLPTFIHGGGHENGLRSGTLNVPGIIALAKACQIASEEMEHDCERITTLRNNLEMGLMKISGAFVNGNIESRIYNVSNICFPGIDANVLIGRMKNVAASNGSACSSSLIEPSHVLTAMGLTENDAFASIRFSLGKYNINEEVHAVLQQIHKLVD